MTDVVGRINEWLENDDIAYPSETLRAARDEIVALRAMLTRQSESAHRAATLMSKYAERYGFLLGGLEMVATGHATAEKVLQSAREKYEDEG
jgi:hypothetical protein